MHHCTKEGCWLRVLYKHKKEEDGAKGDASCHVAWVLRGPCRYCRFPKGSSPTATSLHCCQSLVQEKTSLIVCFKV